MQGVQILLPISGCPNKSIVDDPKEKANVSESCVSSSISFQRTGFEHFNAHYYHLQALSKESLLAGSFRSIRLATIRAYAILYISIRTGHEAVDNPWQYPVQHTSSAARTATATCHAYLACRILKCNRFGKLQRAEKKVATVRLESRQGHSGIMELQQQWQRRKSLHTSIVHSGVGRANDK